MLVSPVGSTCWMLCVSRVIFPCDSSIKDCLTFLRVSIVPPTVNRDRRLDQNVTSVCSLGFCFPLSLCFCLRCVLPVDPLARPEFLLLLLEQGERLLEDHTRLFLVLANIPCYLDDALCTFYDASLNPECKEPLSKDGPRADFTAGHSGPSAQPTISPLRGAHPRVHR